MWPFWGRAQIYPSSGDLHVPHAVDSFLDVIADLVAGKILDKLGPATQKSERRLLPFDIRDLDKWIDNNKVNVN